MKVDKSQQNIIDVLVREIDPEYIKSYFKLLSPLEYAVVKLLLDSEYALSIEQIRTNLVINLYNFIAGLKDKSYLPAGKTGPEFQKWLKKKEESKFKWEWVKSGFKYPTIPGFVEKILRKVLHYKLPSFTRIENCLERLQKFGFVIKRLDEKGLTKGLWTINPKFYILYKKYKNSKYD
jgi:hypothetical protein